MGNNGILCWLVVCKGEPNTPNKSRTQGGIHWLQVGSEHNAANEHRARSSRMVDARGLQGSVFCLRHMCELRGNFPCKANMLPEIREHTCTHTEITFSTLLYITLIHSYSTASTFYTELEAVSDHQSRMEQDGGRPSAVRDLHSIIDTNQLPKVASPADADSPETLRNPPWKLRQIPPKRLHSFRLLGKEQKQCWHILPSHPTWNLTGRHVLASRRRVPPP